MSKFSRRDFLKTSGLFAGGLALTPFRPPLNLYNDGKIVRVGITAINVHSQPNDKSRIIGQRFRDDILNVYEEIVAQTPAYNPVWYRVWGGFVHRKRLQTVRLLYNTPAVTIRASGQLAEVTVPYTQSYRRVRDEWQILYRLYYESVHWVTGVVEGPDGEPWYNLHNELNEAVYAVPAIHMRIIGDDELAPITPELPHQAKRIDVDLTMQTVTAYENDKEVFKSVSSSGLPSHTPPGSIPTITPVGNFHVMSKVPSKHMGDGSLASDIEAYILPGVPWTLFFTSQGHAFHGTYWHNNFGSPMSKGCINMRNDEAKWLFRWVRPESPADYFEAPLKVVRNGFGTPIRIFYS